MLFFHIDMFSTIRPSPRHPNQNKAQQKPIELQLVVPSTELELANLQTTREVICFVKAAVWRPNLREDYRIWNNNYPSMHLSKSMSQRQNCKVMMVGYFCCIFASRSDHTKITCFWWWICIIISGIIWHMERRNCCNLSDWNFKSGQRILTSNKIYARISVWATPEGNNLLLLNLYRLRHLVVGNCGMDPATKLRLATAKFYHTKRKPVVPIKFQSSRNVSIFLNVL